MQIGEKIDHVQEPLDEVTQVVGGQGDGLGRALLAIGHEVANDGQAAEQGSVKESKITVGRGHERRTHPVEQPFGAELDQPVHQRFDRYLATFETLRKLALAVERFVRESLDPDVQIGHDPARKLLALGGVQASLELYRGVLQLGAQGRQAMVIARLGPLGVKRLEEHDVAVEQPRVPADQSIAQPQQKETEPRQADHRQQSADVAEHLDQPSQPQEREKPHGLVGILEACFKLGRFDLVRDESKRERGQKIENQVPPEIKTLQWGQCQFEQKLAQAAPSRSPGRPRRTPRDRRPRASRRGRAGFRR